jgi:hypothetical protein
MPYLIPFHPIPLPYRCHILSLTSWHASCCANTPRQLLPLSASLAPLLGNKCYGIENAAQIEQFKVGLLGLAWDVLSILASGDGSREVKPKEINQMKLETKIRNLILETNATLETRFDVVAHELWGNSREGFETNSSWFITKDADIEEALEAARGRWEVFKVNYLPKARVCDIEDYSCNSYLSLEVGCVPFLEIRIS